MKPKIRFKGFKEEWESAKIRDFSTSFSGGTPSVGIAKYYGGNIPFIRSGEIHNNKTELFLTELGLANSSAKIVEKGTLLYALYGATSGDVTISQIRGAINQAILALYPNNKIKKEFLAHFLCSKKTRIISELLQGGQGNLSGTLVKGITVIYPQIKEQESIADCLNSLDAQISASISHLASLKQIKAASLQAMFPQEGETMPKIRFKGFEGEWESLDLSESFELLKNNTLSRAELTDEGKIANIHYGDILIKYGECIDTAVDKLTYIIDNEVGKNLLKNGALKKGDIIFADTAEDNTVGKCSELICRDNEVIVAGLHTIACRPQIDIAERYLGYYLNSPAYHNQLLPHIQGTKVSSISRKAINTTKVVIPKEKEEQQAIASFFTSLDHQISLYAKRLEKLKHIKAACLEKMFV